MIVDDRVHARLIRTTKQRGFTLVETAVVLGIMSVLISSTFTIVGVVRERGRRELFAQELYTIVAATRNFYSGMANVPTTNSLPTNTQSVAYNLISRKAMPMEMLRDEGGTKVADHPWGNLTGVAGGSLQVGGGGVAGADGYYQGFDVKMIGVPAESCPEIVMRNAGVGSPTGLIDLKINGTSVFSSVPLKVTTATNACRPSSATTNATIEFIYRLRVPQG